ncbi:MAG: putative colanic acid biosynthesis acetyltransferase [Phycisphaerales bacterium]
MPDASRPSPPSTAGSEAHPAPPHAESKPRQDSPHPTSNRLMRLVWSLTCALLFRPSPRPLHVWRNWLLRLFGAKLHPSARVYPRCRVWAPWNLVMHERACLGDDVDCYNVRTITIGANSTVSQYSFLCGATHDFEQRDHPLVPRPITIGSSCWIAADVFVAPGVTIGDGTVVGARSSVFGDLPPWMVCVGSPARPIKPRVIRDS